MFTSEKNVQTQSGLQQTYDRARSNLLLMTILTVLNIIMYFCGSESMMLFSATIPYVAVIIGFESAVDIVLTISVLSTVIIVGLYFLSWFLSKKHFAWMIVALVMFVIDTIVLVYLYFLMEDFSGSIDFIIHIWVLYYLISGVRVALKMRKLPEELQIADVPENASDISSNNLSKTQPLYLADMSGKFRVLLETEQAGCHICYRRVKRTNELVINNFVYDSIEKLIESPHTLSATVNGHLFEVGNDGHYSFIRVDGKQVAKKLRIW